MFKEPCHSQPSAPSSKLRKMLFSFREVVGITLTTAPIFSQIKLPVPIAVSITVPLRSQLHQKEAIFWYGSLMQMGILPEVKGPFLCPLCWFASSLSLPPNYLCFLLLSPFCFLSRVHWVPAVTRPWVRNAVEFLSFYKENHSQKRGKLLSVYRGIKAGTERLSALTGVAQLIMSRSREEPCDVWALSSTPVLHTPHNLPRAARGIGTL